MCFEFESRFKPEEIVAYLTLKWTFAGVRAIMNCKVRLPLEGFTTYITRKWTFVSVHDTMTSKVRLPLEGFITYITRKWTFVGVCVWRWSLRLDCLLKDSSHALHGNRVSFVRVSFVAKYQNSLFHSLPLRTLGHMYHQHVFWEPYQNTPVHQFSVFMSISIHPALLFHTHCRRHLQDAAFADWSWGTWQEEHVFDHRAFVVWNMGYSHLPPTQPLNCNRSIVLHYLLHCH